MSDAFILITRSVPLTLVLLSLGACASASTEEFRSPRTGTETVRMKGNELETPGSYDLAFNLAVVSRHGERGYAAYITYHGPREIQVPFSSGVDLRVGDTEWQLQGMVNREISGIVGGTMGVSSSYVTYIVVTLDAEQVQALLAADQFTIVVNAIRGRYRGTGRYDAIRRMREFVAVAG